MKHALFDSATRHDSAAHYQREGYFVARQLVPRAQVERVFSDMHRLAVQQLRHLNLPFGRGESAEAVHADLQRLFEHALPAYLATLTLCAKLVSLHELYLNPSIRTFTRELGLSFPVFQTAPCMHVMSKALKVPGGYQGFGAHQDWPTLQGSLDTVTVWIPFVDVDKNRFPLELIPRSHTQGLHSYVRRDHIFEVDPASYDAAAFVPMEAARGDIVFMSSFTIHRSSTQGDDRLRVATSMRYENAADPTFIARSYPFAHKRSVLPELITPNFPGLQDVQAVFGATGRAP